MGWLSGLFGEMPYKTKYKPSKNFEANNSDDYGTDANSNYADSGYEDSDAGWMSSIDKKIIELNKEELKVETFNPWEEYRQSSENTQKFFGLIIMVFVGFTLVIAGGFAAPAIIIFAVIFAIANFSKSKKKQIQKQLQKNQSEF